MDELVDSVVRVVWDPSGTPMTLVNYGDPMWEPVRVDGGQAVQIATRIRAVGVLAIPRKNEQHEITFTRCFESGSVANAIYRSIYDARTLPRIMADVRIDIEGQGSFLLKNASIARWPHGNLEHLTQQSVSIIGGEIEASSSGASGPTWGDEHELWES